MKKIIYISFFSSLSFFNNVQSAGLLNPTDRPLETYGYQSPQPNIMFVFDNSKDMKKSYSDNFFELNICSGINDAKEKVLFKDNCFLNKGTIQDDPLEFTTTSKIPDVLYFSYDVNKIYYNPNVKYEPPVKINTDGTIGQYPQINYNSAPRDGFDINSSTINLETEYKSLKWCNSTNVTETTKCKNSIETTKTDYYKYEYPSGEYIHPVSYNSNAYYYKILPIEYCEENGVNCIEYKKYTTGEETVPTYENPSYSRWCANAYDAHNINYVVSSGTVLINEESLPKCVFNYNDNYKYPRIGLLQKVYITTNEEKQNFANWYSYYRTKLNILKSTTGNSFKNLDEHKRIGFINTNPLNSPSIDYLEINKNDITQKKKFYDILYNQTANTEPSKLKNSLAKVGRYFSKKESSMNDPIVESCQQNFTIVGVGSKWHDLDSSYKGLNLNSSFVENIDNEDKGFTKSNIGAYDGGNSSGSLADIAAYYYGTDLRNNELSNSFNVVDGISKDVSINNVKISNKDLNSSQHMNTSIVSIGIEGFLKYNENYEQNKSKYLEKIKHKASNDISSGTTFCFWSKNLCYWPTVESGKSSTVDDLWHASINGRGFYYQGNNAKDIEYGKNKVLNKIFETQGSSSVAVTSTPNITVNDNYIFYTNYTTGKWHGDILKKKINIDSGVILDLPEWSAKDKIKPNNSSRPIKFLSLQYLNGVDFTGLTDFKYTFLPNNQKTYFNGFCDFAGIDFSQCNNTNNTILNSGANLVNYLRGQTTYATYYRERDFILGDIVNSNPVFISKTDYKWTDEGHSEFQNNKSNNRKVLIVGANDGMLHAINVSGSDVYDDTVGKEAWAIIPGQLLKKLYKLADKNYQHEYFVDGIITVMDVYDSYSSSWKTILVSGLGKGGKGYFAIDITNPADPLALWEMCIGPNDCLIQDSDLGYSFGNPIITKRGFDNKWVVYVSSGYDNSSGKGIIYELDAIKGTILRKLEAPMSGVSASNQVGISKINAFYEDFNVNNKALGLYAGDLNGNVWKWDLTNNSTTNGILLGKATSPTGENQPITTKIELSKIEDNVVLFFGTGKYLNENDQNNTNYIKNSFYAIKENLDVNLLGKNFRNNFGLRNSTNLEKQKDITISDLNWSSSNGWFFDFSTEFNEIMNIDPILSVGNVNIITNVPAESICTTGGKAFNYQIDYKNGTTLDNEALSEEKKYKEIPSGFVVGQSLVKLRSGLVKNVIQDSSGNIKLTESRKNNKLITINNEPPKRVSWREIITKGEK